MDRRPPPVGQGHDRPDLRVRGVHGDPAAVAEQVVEARQTGARGGCDQGDSHDRVLGMESDELAEVDQPAGLLRDPASHPSQFAGREIASRRGMAA